MNAYGWRDSNYLITFIIGHKYCTVASSYGTPEEIFEAVLEWHKEIDPQGAPTPFVPVSEVVCPIENLYWAVENELVQVQVNI